MVGTAITKTIKWILVLLQFGMVFINTVTFYSHSSDAKVAIMAAITFCYQICPGSSYIPFVTEFDKGQLGRT